MKLLDINMEELIETISSVDDDLGKSFLDTHTGEAIYIPSAVCLSLENKTLKEDTFDDWLQEFVEIAILINEDEVNRYLSTPVMNEEFYINAMKEYTNSIISNPNLKLELNRALNGEEPIKNFKHTLMDKENEIDKWYLYEDKCVEEYILQWLQLNELQLKS